VEVTLSYKSKHFCKGAPGRFVYTGRLIHPASRHRGGGSWRGFVPTTTKPPYLHHLITVQRPHNTRSSSLVTLARPPTSSSLRITDRSFQCALPCLWNQLPLSLRQPHSTSDFSLSLFTSVIYTASVPLSLSSSITPFLFHSQLKTYLFFSNHFHHIDIDSLLFPQD